jgi:hypothetical protein
MQSQMGVPTPYSLELTRYGTGGTTVDAYLISGSGDHACYLTGGTFEDDRFSFGQSGGWFWCDVGRRVNEYACTNGERRDLLTAGHTLDGHVSGDTINGTWGVRWAVTPSDEFPPSWSEDLQTTTEFGGSR